MRPRSSNSLLNRAKASARQLAAEKNETSSGVAGTAPPSSALDQALTILRDATLGTPFEDHLWIVGGYVRDKLLGRLSGGDVDLVTQASSIELANLLRERGVTEIAPVVYARFGTAMVRIAGCDIELVTARKESYAEDSRKPVEVQAATLEEDAQRRDFTINTLMENLHTGEQRDPTGRGLADLRAGCIRTPLPPVETFIDDPLRMLRAVRFAARLGFAITPHTWDAICRQHERLKPPKVSCERIRDEFNKILMAAAPSQGLELLRRSDLLSQFAPELCEGVGVIQNEWHHLPVWDHTLLALDNLVAVQPTAPLLLRWATLLHDVGKPRTKTIGEDGRIHFYGHPESGARMSRALLSRLKFSTNDIETVAHLVDQHMRIGEYKPEVWSDSAVRRLVRDTGDQLPGLFALHRADVSALSGEHTTVSRAHLLQERIDALENAQPSAALESPLTGADIMDALDLRPGPEVGRWKEFLLNEVLEGRLAADDKTGAVRLLRERRAAWRIVQET